MPKPGNWGDWAVIHKPKPTESSLCGGCSHCDEDGACNVLPIIVWDVGPNYWRKCPHFSTGTVKTAKPENKSQPAPQEDRNKHDCRYCSYIASTNQYVCTCADSPCNAKECVKCQHYIREVILFQGRKLSRVEYEQLLAKPKERKPAPPTAKAKPSKANTAKKQKNAKTPASPKITTADKSMVSAPEVKNNTKSKVQKEKKAILANPKKGCKYLDGVTCIIQHAPCTRGSEDCLFFKSK